ncbi:MAG: hypothetical protein R2713_04275 [Ilumatobacteraceae bacterium]
MSQASTASPDVHPADAHDLIRVHGARENNLKDISIELPKRRLTVFTGVSGSGKSSLVFGTIAAESQRLINETYSAFVQGFMPSLARPDVDVLDGLTTAIIVDQQRMGGDTRATVGTATDANAMLRILFSRLGEPHIGPPSAFSFNVPSVKASGSITVQKGGDAKAEKVTFTRTGGMCPRCRGPRHRVRHRPARAVRRDDLDRRRRDPHPRLQHGGLVRAHLPWVRLLRHHQADRPVLRAGTPRPAVPRTHEDQGRRHQHHLRRARAVGAEVVPVERRRLVAAARACLRGAGVDVHPVSRLRRHTAERGSAHVAIRGVNIAEACAMQISDLAEWVRGLDEPPVGPLLATLGATLDSFVEIGLGYLSLDRPSGTLSGGEAQRTKMIRHLGSSLTDVTYVFDEPTVGLHPHDIQRMNDLLLRLRDKGNTVLVVEHKPEVIAIADHVVDLGPGAGAGGGTVCFEGTLEGLRSSGTLTGRHLDDRSRLKPTVRTPTGRLEVRGASTHNLCDVDVDIPLGVLVVVTGVAGSGKSSLIHGSVAGREGVVAIDQSPIRGSRRSNPATYTGLLEPIRKAFAKANGVKPALFSANSQGACPTCNGAGVVYTDLGMMAGVSTTCEDCEGKRFDASVLDYHLGGRDISEVLAMPAAEAADSSPRARPASRPRTRSSSDSSTSASVTSRSGSRSPRCRAANASTLKLATHMGGKGGVYVLDEPTSGLHLADVEQLLGLLDRLVDGGTSVIVIEHHQAVMAHADGSSTSARARATTVAGSCSRAPRPTWSLPAPPHRPAPRRLRHPLTPPRPDTASRPRARNQTQLVGAVRSGRAHPAHPRRRARPLRRSRTTAGRALGPGRAAATADSRDGRRAGGARAPPHGGAHRARRARPRHDDPRPLDTPPGPRLRGVGVDDLVPGDAQLAAREVPGRGAPGVLLPERPWALAPAPLAPTGTLRPVDGGFVVSGRWEWATCGAPLGLGDGARRGRARVHDPVRGGADRRRTGGRRVAHLGHVRDRQRHGASRRGLRSRAPGRPGQ